MSRLPYTHESQRDEHDNASPETKRVSLYGWDTVNLQKVRLAATSDGAMNVNATLSAPSGVYGLRFRRKFGGQSENGVTIRLNTDDEDAFQVVIQDDLTGLTKFHVIVHGHIVI